MGDPSIRDYLLGRAHFDFAVGLGGAYAIGGGAKGVFRVGLVFFERQRVGDVLELAAAECAVASFATGLPWL
ncbi:hypothetical protein NT6N_20460 [Oceaniferula spumae]|uniref:Uncharacterized protein n=1 Tax=Oceaniferula spumae TaxID=2979115 RepID=A0AAT9FM61_9BACT